MFHYKPLVVNGMSKEYQQVSIILEKFERTKVLEVYFLRAQGKSSANIPQEYGVLFEIDLKLIRQYLLDYQSKSYSAHLVISTIC